MLPLRKKRAYRILSLDGGGVRGALTAWLLENMETLLNGEDKQKIPLGQRFHLIAGTSVGAILALSLASGKTARETRKFWLGDGGGGRLREVFGHPRSLPRWLFRSAKYDSKPLQKALEDWFREKTLKDLGVDGDSPHVLITSTALARPSLRTWKSPSKPEFKPRAGSRLADVAQASAAAPVFFRAKTDSGDQSFDAPLVDGGLCANNPSITAIIEALGLGRKLDQIRLVSVGTGIPCSMPYDPRKVGLGGAKRWFYNRQAKAIPLVELMMAAQADMTHQQAKFMLRDRGRYLRVDPQLKFPMSLDEYMKVPLLRAYADLTQEDCRELRDMLL